MRRLAVLLILNASSAVAEESLASDSLTRCVTIQVQAGGYSSADAGDSAFALSSACRAQAAAYTRACELAGKHECVLATLVAIQDTMADLGK